MGHCPLRERQGQGQDPLHQGGQVSFLNLPDTSREPKLVAGKGTVAGTDISTSRAVRPASVLLCHPLLSHQRRHTCPLLPAPPGGPTGRLDWSSSQRAAGPMAAIHRDHLRACGEGRWPGRFSTAQPGPPPCPARGRASSGEATDSLLPPTVTGPRPPLSASCPFVHLPPAPCRPAGHSTDSGPHPPVLSCSLGTSGGQGRVGLAQGRVPPRGCCAEGPVGPGPRGGSSLPWV